MFASTVAAIVFRSLRNAAHITLLVGALFAVLVWGASNQPVRDMDRAPSPGTPAALMEQHDCWEGEPPADMVGKLPGHVVVTVDGETRVGGSRMVGKALSQLFEGEDHGLTIHGFCR